MRRSVECGLSGEANAANCWTTPTPLRSVRVCVEMGVDQALRVISHEDQGMVVTSTALNHLCQHSESMQENPKPGVDVRESSVWGSAV